MGSLKTRFLFAWLIGIEGLAHAQAGSSPLRQAQAAEEAERWTEAAALYEQARAAAPLDPVPARGACRAALAREEAGEVGVSSRSACHRALMQGTRAEDLRNEAASMLMPGNKPSLDDIAVTVLGAEGALRQGGNEPWGYVASCDIARRLGSVDTLEWCLGELQRVAPRHPVTKKTLAAATEHASPGAWALRCLVLLSFLGTVAHALRRRVSARSYRPPLTSVAGTATVGLCVLGALLGTRPAMAAEPLAKPRDTLGDVQIDDANPETSIPSLEQQTKQPLQFGYYLQDLIEHADNAAKRADHAASARLYKTLTLAAPVSAVGPRKWCEQAEAMGDYPTAIIACRTAITNPGSTNADVARFVGVVVASDKPLPPLEEKELDNVITHLEKQTKPDALSARLRCEVALRFKNTPALETCTRELLQWAPNDPKTVSFQWALAIAKHDPSTAETLIDRARDLGMSPAGLVRMEQTTSDMSRGRMGRFMLAGLAVLMLVFGTRSTLRWLASRRRVAT